mmetsp:Transcript_15374/g.46406  ORF Transcript_15374/g.46406 Transcript_15374/m.46406 type:complete len:204 (-) Transcript_15374:1320-1931(-)
MPLGARHPLQLTLSGMAAMGMSPVTPLGMFAVGGSLLDSWRASWLAAASQSQPPPPIDALSTSRRLRLRSSWRSAVHISSRGGIRTSPLPARLRAVRRPRAPEFRGSSEMGSWLPSRLALSEITRLRSCGSSSSALATMSNCESRKSHPDSRNDCSWLHPLTRSKFMAESHCPFPTNSMACKLFGKCRSRLKPLALRTLSCGA